MDARNYFDPVTGAPPFHRNQYGGSVGGPIKKDRTFFFVDYEGLGQVLGVSTPRRSAFRRGDLAISQLKRDANHCNSESIGTTISCLLAHSDNALGHRRHWTVDVITQRSNSEYFVAGRIDQQFSASDSLFGTYQYDHGIATQPDNLDDVRDGSATTREYIILQENHIVSPRFTNAARAGFNRSTALNDYGVSAINPVAANLPLGPDGTARPPSIVVGGIASLTSGLITEPSTVFHYNDYQFYDDAFFTKGVQSLKFGFAAERMQDNTGQNVGIIAGQYKFGTLSEFLQDLPSSFRGNTTQGRVEYLRQNIFGGYLQDDIRFAPNLTVNLGLRYEMSTVPTGKIQCPGKHRDSYRS